MNKTQKVRTIVAAMRNTTIDRISADDGEVKLRMRHSLKNNIQWEYEQALQVLRPSA